MLSVNWFSSSAAAAVKSFQSRLTLCDPVDGSPPGSPVPGILRARTLEWVAISFSNNNSYELLIHTRHYAKCIPYIILTQHPELNSAVLFTLWIRKVRIERAACPQTTADQ